MVAKDLTGIRKMILIYHFQFNGGMIKVNCGGNNK